MPTNKPPPFPLLHLLFSSLPNNPPQLPWWSCLRAYQAFYSQSWVCTCWPPWQLRAPGVDRWWSRWWLGQDYEDWGRMRQRLRQGRVVYQTNRFAAVSKRALLSTLGQNFRMFFCALNLILALTLVHLFFCARRSAFALVLSRHSSFGAVRPWGVS